MVIAQHERRRTHSMLLPLIEQLVEHFVFVEQFVFEQLIPLVVILVAEQQFIVIAFVEFQRVIVQRIVQLQFSGLPPDVRYLRGLVHDLGVGLRPR